MKQNLFIVFALFLFSINLTQQRPLNFKKIIHAINCGSQRTKRASGGYVYSEDKFLDQNDFQSQVIDYRQLEDFKNEFIYYTDDKEIYMTQRYSQHGNIQYNIPTDNLEKNKKYVVILQFMEFEYSRPGKRKFNINLGDYTVYNEYDIASKNQNRGGVFVKQDEYLEFLLLDNNKIKFHQMYKDHIINLNQDGSLPVILEQVENYPVINGIILFNGSVLDTNKHEVDGDNRFWLDQHKKEWNEHRHMKNEQKQKYIDEQRQKRIQFKEEQEQLLRQKGKVYPSIYEMIQTPLGALMMVIVFISSFTMVYFTFFDPYGIEKEELEKQKKKLKKNQSKSKNQYQQISVEDEQITNSKNESKLK